MMHRVQQGECLSSIAARYGHGWKDVWEHPENAKLRDKRKDPNILHPGDVLFVPDKKIKTEPAATNARHRFKVRLDKTAIHLRLTGAHKPLDGEPYELSYGRTTIEGKTDGDGKLEASVPADVSEVMLVLPRRRQRYTLALGHLDPAETPSGADQRLRNLRMTEGERPDTEGYREALAMFQRIEKLEVTGKLDDKTAEKLKKAHGC